MSWTEAMADSYSRGVRDGRKGFREGRGEDPQRADREEAFLGCYEQGYRHGWNAERLS